MIAWIFGAALIALAVFALLSPLESVRWWATKGEEEVEDTFEHARPGTYPPADTDRFIVYLAGVGDVGGSELSDREDEWLTRLQAELPRATIIADVFPYAVDNRGLLQRATVRLWGWLDNMRRTKPWIPLPLLINLRNVLQVLVSADPRYGPAKDVGLAQEVWRSLQRHGYQPGSGVPVTFIGYSGGAQMAVGAAWFLNRLGVPVDMIGLGGIFGANPGLQRLEHITLLTGSNDSLRFLTWAFPGRWPSAPLSNWGRAKSEGRVTERVIGPFDHDGEKGYFGRKPYASDPATAADDGAASSPSTSPAEPVTFSDASREVTAAVLRTWMSEGSSSK